MNEIKFIKELVNHNTGGAIDRLESTLREKLAEALSDAEAAYSGPGQTMINKITIILESGDDLYVDLKVPIYKVKPIEGIEFNSWDDEIVICSNEPPEFLKDILEEIDEEIEKIPSSANEMYDLEGLIDLVSTYGIGDYEYNNFILGTPLEKVENKSEAKNPRYSQLSCLQVIENRTWEGNSYQFLRLTNRFTGQCGKPVFSYEEQKREIEKVIKEFHGYLNTFPESKAYLDAWDGRKSIIRHVPPETWRVLVFSDQSEESKKFSFKPCMIGSDKDEEDWWKLRLKEFRGGKFYTEWRKEILEKGLTSVYSGPMTESDNIESLRKLRKTMTDQEWERDVVEVLGGDPIETIEIAWKKLRGLFR